MTLQIPPTSPQGVARSSLARVWAALDAGGFKPEKRADKFLALCPVHGDTHRSLSVKWDAGRGAVLLHCFACQASVDEIARALGLSVQDTFDEPLPPRGDRPIRRRQPSFQTHKLPARIVPRAEVPIVEDPGGWERVSVYKYTDATGTPVQEVYREQSTVDGVVQKRFTQRFRGPNGRMVTRKPAGFVPVLYRHGPVLEAVKAGSPVWLVEGEKDADNAAAVGLVATTNAQGAGSFPQELASVFAGAQVNVVADRDAAGYKRAAQLHELLASEGATVRLLLPAIDQDKADLTDHLEAGLSLDELVEISAQDAVTLGKVAEGRKLVDQSEECVAEVRAHLAAETTEPDGQHADAAETWADESAIRFGKLLELAEPPVDVELGPLGQRALGQLRELVDEAAVTAVTAHQLAGRRVPSTIADRAAKVGDGRVVSFGGSEPPIFRGNPLGPDDDPTIGVTYLVRDGETVQAKRERTGDGYVTRYYRVMRGWAEVLSVGVDDDGIDDSSSGATSQLKVRFFRWARDDDGTIKRRDDGQPELEQQDETWDAEALRDGSWATSVPWPGMFESSSRRGKDQVWDAIFNARPTPSAQRRTTVYTATGWRDGETGPFFVHAGGAIAKGGAIDVDTRFADAFNPYALPAPSNDVDELRAAWLQGAAPIREELPARVVAPLFGVVWRSVFERVPFITHLVGGRAAFKTSTARLACQFFAPGMHFRGRREILSGANMGSSVIGLIRALQVTPYLPVLIDDVAPDGNAKRAQEKLSQLGRLVYNETGRVTGKQRGGVNTDHPTKATVITTGELAITGSGQTRLLAIPLDPGAIAKGSETFAELERSASRNARALLGATLIQWIAQHRDALQDEMLDEDETHPNSLAALNWRWRDRLKTLPHDPGLRDRLTEAAVAADHGIILMLRMLTSAGVLDRDEATEFHTWAEAGIREAVGLQDATSGDPAEQLLGYIREALSSGAAHLTTDSGDVPENPNAFGWATRGVGENAIWASTGPRLGVIRGDRVFLIPSTTIGIANQVSQRADETFSETAVSISSALVAHGWLTVDGSGKRAVGRRINGSLVRVWDIPLTVITGDDPAGGDQPGTTTPDQPAPASPQLFDDSPAAAPLPPDPTPAAPTAGAAALPVPAAAPAAQRPASSTKSSPRFRAAVAVLDAGNQLWLPDGEQLTLDHPIEHLGDVARLIKGLGLGVQNGWKTEDGQLLVTAAAALELGIPVDQLTEPHRITEKLKALTLDHPLITGAIDAGFQVGGRERSLNTTTRVWHSNDSKLRGRFVLLPTLKDDFKHIVDDNPHPATIATRLQRFADALHAPYAVSASSTGLDLMFNLPKSRELRERYFTPSTVVPPAEIPTLEADIDWQRKPTDQELEHQWVHAYDRGASYLAGVAGLELGYGEPTHYPQGRPFDAKLPGYWRITMPAKGEWLTPNPIDPRNREDDITGKLTWVTTQTLDVATAFGYDDFEIHEAWIWEQHTRIYDTWYERIRDARTTLDTSNHDDQRARDLLKEVYVRSLGLTASFEHHKDREGFAPERYHFVQARAKANILRRVLKIGEDTGRWPVAISKDTVLYTSPSSEPDIAWPGDTKNYGRGLGQFKYEGSARLADHLQYLTGAGRYDGKSDLMELI